MLKTDWWGEKQHLTVKYRILKVDVQRNLAESVNDDVVMEEKVELYVNEKRTVVFFCSPSQIKELVIGYLMTKGAISMLDEIKQIKIAKGKVHVHLDKKAKDQTPLNRKAEQGTAKIKADTVLKAVETLDSKASIFRKTGGTHAAALFNWEGDVLMFSEDVGRHNALDKVIGEASSKGVSLGKTILASTGRLTLEIVTKAVHTSIPIVISVSAPTNAGIEVAEKAGLTLIGFARKGRFNVYTHPVRIMKL